MGIFVPGQVVYVREVLAPWVARLNDELAGMARIKLFTGGALGRDGAMQLHLLERGVLDVTWFITSYEAGRFPDADPFAFPLLSDDPMALTIAFWRAFERGLLEDFDEIKPLAISVSPPYNFHLAFPIDDLDGLQGRKIRVINAAQAQVVQAVGATAVAGAGAMEIAESLSRGLIDGTLFNWHSLLPVGLHLTTQVHIEQPVAFSPAVLAMNKESFAALPVAARKVIEANSGEALSIAITRSMLNEARKTRRALRESDRHRFYLPSPAEKQQFRAAFDALGASWRKQNPERRDLLDTLRTMLSEIESERVDVDLEE
jgi:TRAP-type C4-dicarboxylate transport system substrate-binding protein